MPMDNVTLENTQQSISSRDAKSVASVMVNGKWVNLSDTLEQANVKSDVGTVAKQVAAQQEVVSNAVSVADSAQSAADAAVASAQVTSDAVSAIASATAEAKQGANDAMSRAMSAWDVATGAKEAVTDFDPLLKSAQSDAGKALTQIADTANALSDAKAELSSDVAVTKNLANMAQTTADSAVKSASSVANDLTAVASQAKANANGITKVTSDVGLLQTTVADNSGNISTIQETAKQIQQAVSDNAGNITVAKQTADSAVAVASDAKSNATVAIQTASQASITASNASGQAASAVITANGAMTTASNANSNATVAVQTASGASLTAINANSDATVAKQTASEAKVQASNAESDFAQLSIRAGQIEASVANNSGAIASVQQTANGLTTTVANITSNGGGRNLLRNSNVELYGKAYSFGSVTLTVDHLDPGETYTMSWYGKVDANATKHKQPLQVYIYNDSWSWCAIGTIPYAANEYQRNVFTFTVPNNVTDANRVSFYLKHYNDDNSQSQHDTDSDAGIGYVKDYMLENGTVAHDWSPAPEDLQNQFTQIKQSIDGVTTTINDPKTGLNATYQTAAGNATTISNVKSDVYQLETTANGLTSRVGNLESKTNTQETEIEQNKSSIALKADQTTVDKTNGDVQQLQSQLKVQAGQISSKVSSSDLDAKGYATQSYTQTQIKQTADQWNANLASVKDSLTKSYTDLHATVDGIQTQVYNSDGTSKITQLSTVVQSKVSQGDYNSQITQLKNDINLRVAKGDVISQINQEAGGNTLIQVSNGKGSFVLDAANTIMTGKAWIPVAAIADLTADQIQAGTLSGSTIHLDDNNGNTIDLGGLATNYVGFHSKATNGDQTYIDRNGIYNCGATYATKISQGQITTNLLSVNGGGLIDFRSSGNGTTLSDQEFQFYNSGSVNGGLSFSGSVPIAPAADGAGGNELRIRYDRSFAVTPISDDSARICASPAVLELGFIQSGSSTPDLNNTGIWVDRNNRYMNLGVWETDSTWTRISAGSHNIQMQANDAHAWLYKNNFHIYRDNDGGSATATELQVDGWAWVRGWVEAAGHSQHSTLSSKTRIEEADPNHMLDLVNNTELTTFAFKSEVAEGTEARHIGPIIDDVNDVAQYRMPAEFIAPTKTARDDDNMIGALFGAVQALTKRINALESKVG